MSDIQKDSFINLVDLVASFNDKVWVVLKEQIGTLYARNAETLTEDTGPSSSGEISISVEGVPQMNANAAIGVNVKSSKSYIPVKNALPPEHLQTVKPDVRRFFTLKWEDVKNLAYEDAYEKAIKSGKTEEEAVELANKAKEIIYADAVYKACFDILRHLISIRPLRTTWIHDATGKPAKYAFTKTFDYYAIYEDKDSSVLDSTIYNDKQVPAVDPERHNVNGFAGSFYEWTGYSKGADFSIYSAIDNPEEGSQVVSRNNCVPGAMLVSSLMNREIAIFWEAWANKCLNKNKFTYTYHTCHISCYSDCWCYGSRGRR